jgi:D-lactate dehydrogenase
MTMSSPSQVRSPLGAAPLWRPSPQDGGIADLVGIVGPDNVLISATDLVRYSSDASPYRLVPRVVVLARDGRDIAEVFRFASRSGRGVVLRAAGTSLNGQSQGDDILLDVRRHFDGVAVEADGQRVRAAPGVVLARVNARLAPFGRMLGPDPASSASACLGGVIANNASGMACGVRDNAYRTVESMRIVLPSGTRVDTGSPDADEQLAAAEPQLAAHLSALRDEIRADSALVARIREKFSIKNTNGYRLDAFLDADTPSGILRGLLVGSQGTLGFVEEAVLRTVPFGRRHTTAFFHFADLFAAATAVPVVMGLGARAAELLDNLSIRATRVISGAPAWMHDIGADDAALLVEYRAADEADLTAFEDAATSALRGIPLHGQFTRDAVTANGYWAVRKGLLTALGAHRPAGTVLLAEDVCVRPGQVAEAAVALRETLEAHSFDAAVAGHASAGNLHFTLVFDPADPAEVRRYAACMQDVAGVVLDRFDGALKGEHATGRNMAPFLEREWGPRLTGLMRRVKEVIDPHGILGEGVVFTDDPQAHLRNLKSIPLVHPDLDRCIECGFCEPVCPSRDLTTTPRQRIVLRREIGRQNEAADDGAVARTLENEYAYAGVDTCAGDGSCAIACPVDIDTGEVMKQLRRARHTPRAEGVALYLARHWAAAERTARVVLRVARKVADTTGDAPLRGATRLSRRVGDPDLLPEWLPATPGAAPPVPRTAVPPEQASAVYFPSCVNRIFGAPPSAADPTTVSTALVALAERAGVGLWVPPDVAGSCCATVWHSKGYHDASRYAANDVIQRLWRWTDAGRLPVVIDASSCTLGLTRDIRPVLHDINRQRHTVLRIVDALTWTRAGLLPRLMVTERVERAVVHPTCSMRHLGITDDLRMLAAALADHVVEPVTGTCCGFAGDRGFLHRELPESATRAEAAEIGSSRADLYVSGNRPCELGMQHTTGRTYESALVALERATRTP